MTNSELPGDWRFMEAGDVAEVSRISAAIHPGFPEDDRVFFERLKLFPRGCFVLESGGKPGGYLFSHPWRVLDIPPLNTLLGALPGRPETYYLHDIALMPETRSKGASASIVAHVLRLAQADGLASCSLVAVNSSAPFWQRFGFIETCSDDMQQKLGSYGSDARFMTHRF